jgi:hypothetical protein
MHSGKQSPAPAQRIIMSLTRIDSFARVDAKLPPQEAIAELCRVLFDTQRKLVEINNECIELRRELDGIKSRVG